MSVFGEKNAITGKSLLAPEAHLAGRLTFSILFVACLFGSCQKEHTLPSDNRGANATEAVTMANAAKIHGQGNGPTVTQITFTATAQIDYCHGENILFTGTIENRVKKTVSASGQVHYTRHFTVKGMMGTGVETGTIYDVVGGAEMFSIKNPVFNLDGSLNLTGSLAESDIVIHRGTLVFVSRTDGSRVVARHDIQKVPGAGLLQNRWLCAGN